MPATRHPLSITHIGCATAIFEIGGLRIMTDPTVDPPQHYYGHYTEGLNNVIKTRGPALQAHEIGKIDVCFISHDHHIDHLDYTGRDFIKSVPDIYTSPLSAVRLRLPGQAKGLPYDESVTVELPEGGQIRITAIPAHHGPAGVWEALGPVTGFVVEGDCPKTYFTGDNADVGLSQEIIDRFPGIEIAVLHAGGPSFEEFGEITLTYTNDQVLEVSKMLPEATMVPMHMDSWVHFKQGPDTMRDTFIKAGIEERLMIPTWGEREVIKE